MSSLYSLQVEKRAKTFLQDVMGQENYSKFIKEGKIEIKSRKCVYELDIHGIIINKTNNQKYCIVPAPGTPDRDNIPLFDLIAIKYSWLKYRADTVERVAHRTYLDTSEPVRERATYYDFIRYMQDLGWNREQLTIDEHNENFVSIRNINAGEVGHIVEVRAPVGNIISIIGTQQIPRTLRDNIFAHLQPHRLIIRIADIQDVEIAPDTDIEIIKESITRQTICINRLHYGYISPTKNNLYTLIQRRDSEHYAFREGILLHHYENLKVNIINPDRDIKNVKFELDLDLWTIE